MLLVATYIAPSEIEGVGVFAAEPIPAGTVIWRFDARFDRLLPRSFVDEAPEHMADYLDRYAYPLIDDPDTLVLEIDNGRFMNHDAKQPNTDFSALDYGTAKYDIAVDEELTCDYGDFYPGFELVPAGAQQNGGAGESQRT